MSTNPEKESFFKRCWNGNIRPWRAFWIINVLGFILALFIGLVLQVTALTLYGEKLPGLVNAVFLLALGVFSSVTMWRSTPNPKTSLSGALAKIWVILFGIYILLVSFTLITEF